MTPPCRSPDHDLKTLLKNLPEHEPGPDFDHSVIQALIAQNQTQPTTKARSWRDLLRPSHSGQRPSILETPRGISGIASITGIAINRPAWLIGGVALLGLITWGAGALIDTLYFAPELAEVDLLSVMLFGAL
jgi:hypothetical protein